MAYDEKVSKALNKLAEKEKPKVAVKKTIVNTRIDDNMLNNLDAYAKATGQSRSKAMNDLMELGFKSVIEQYGGEE